jgi:hypothetical protein
MQIELSSKIQSTQEHLKVTTEKVNTNAKSYSQIVSTPPVPHHSPCKPHTHTYGSKTVKQSSVAKY